MWQASHQGPDGSRHSVPTTFQAKGDAAAWLALQQGRIIERRWKPSSPRPSTQTLTAYAESWLSARELRPRTRSEYRRILDLRILPTLGRERLGSLTAAAVRSWYAEMGQQYPRARAHAYGLLRVILNSAVEDELIETNPSRIAALASRNGNTTSPQPRLSSFGDHRQHAAAGSQPEPSRA
jgi:hypothetical protein